MKPLITVNRAEARDLIADLFDDYNMGLSRAVTESDIDKFIEFVEIYGCSERMYEDYLDEVKP